MMPQGYICKKTSILINRIVEIVTNKPNATRCEIQALLIKENILKVDKRGYDRLNWCIVKHLEQVTVKDDRANNNGKYFYPPPPKFQIGDKVRIKRGNGRTPQYLTNSLRVNNPRTITAMFPMKRGDKYCGHVYYLGSNKQGNDLLESHAFRPNELVPFVKGNIGRPRSRRLYSRRNPLAGMIPHESSMRDSLVHCTLSPSISCVNCI